ncbi:hypothetical protein K1T35_42160 [Pseudonocardia sp. DSM 110487]|uniref:hypothetical protein n=1 Tax=Pseudonocardia sp. DSM 110487 TaxID=2865833 RepID=UPI001C6966DE|nr:hypothetical protein [Pseudonocardia sp. DSM 110487]QYN34893.1 hypothetical protein K1T35_42160 [Pseudonocardia sp. DSM 110487]
MELGAGALIIAFALVVIVGLVMATRPRRTVVPRPGAIRPRLAVRLRRRRRRVADRVRTRWQAATTRSTRSDGSIASWWSVYASGDDSSPSYDSGGGGSSDYGGGGSSDSGGGGGGGGGGD